jgi:hypothetical protein
LVFKFLLSSDLPRYVSATRQ